MLLLLTDESSARSVARVYIVLRKTLTEGVDLLGLVWGLGLVWVSSDSWGFVSG
jgi:hypothetical protein